MSESAVATRDHVDLRALGVDFDHACFGCGDRNDAGLHIQLSVSPGRAEGRYTALAQHQSYHGSLHGGVVSALLDETMGWAVFHQGIWGITGRLSVTFRKAVPTGEALRITGEVVRDRGRALETRGAVVRASDGEVLAEGEALFFRMPADRQRELEAMHPDAREMVERIKEALATEAEA